MQDDTLSGEVSTVDVATAKNLENLVKIGEGLLKKPVSRVNLNTGVYEASDEVTITNEQALIKYNNTLTPFSSYYYFLILGYYYIYV